MLILDILKLFKHVLCLLYFLFLSSNQLCFTTLSHIFHLSQQILFHILVLLFFSVHFLVNPFFVKLNLLLFVQNNQLKLGYFLLFLTQHQFITLDTFAYVIDECRSLSLCHIISMYAADQSIIETTQLVFFSLLGYLH